MGYEEAPEQRASTNWWCKLSARGGGDGKEKKVDSIERSGENTTGKGIDFPSSP